jgi:hypothetical protein
METSRFFLKFAVIVTVIGPLAMAAVAIADTCVQDVHNVLAAYNQTTKFRQNVDKAQLAVGRKITAKEEDALEVIFKEGNKDAYMASEVAKQTRDLTKAGFNESEIMKLRKNGVIGNSVVSHANGSPTGLGFFTGPLDDFSGATLKQVESGKKLYYVSSEDGRIFTSSSPFTFPNDKVMVVSTPRGGLTGTDAAVNFVAREAGEITYDTAQKSLVFRPKYGLHAGDAETREIISNVSAINPGVRTVYQASPAIPHSRVIQCLDILSAQQNGRNFVLDRVIAENAVLVAGVGAGEMLGAGRMKTSQGQLVIAGDVAGTTINTIAGASIAKQLVLKDANFATSMAVRTGMGLGMIEAQKYVHKAFMAPEQQQVAEDIAAFNRAHFFARMPINHVVDNFMIKTLPRLVFDSCQRNSRLTAAISPRAVRMYERGASAVLYYGARQAIVGQ